MLLVAQIEMDGAFSNDMHHARILRAFWLLLDTSSPPLKHANTASFSHDPVVCWKLPTDSV